MMFEVVELGRKIEKTAYKARTPDLRKELLDTQFQLEDANFSAIVIIGGVEGAGKGDCTNRILEWLDTRGVETHALGPPTTLEAERPEYYRYWLRLPPTGKIGIFLGSWYSQHVIDRVFQKTTDTEFEHELNRISAFERMLANENVLVLKFWLHVSKEHQKKRLKKLAADPMTSFRVSENDWIFHENYDQFIKVSEKTIRETSTAHAPWTLVEAHDARYRDLTIAQHIQNALQARLQQPESPRPEKPGPLTPEVPNIISSLDLSQTLEREDYKAQLSYYQARMGLLARKLQASDKSVVLVFEGSDAAGKGGSIRRVISAVDARQYNVIQISAPTEEERARPYLWRFWRKLPRQGRVTVFDRSWYGRVLVERIEGFCHPEDWQRAFNEINNFEEQLTENGTIVIKFWLTISDEEQLRRFQERENTGYKRYKLTEEDWRNRDKAPSYEAAACDMIEKTSTDIAPWTLIEAESKQFARVKVLKTVVETLEKHFGTSPQEKAKKKDKKPQKNKKAKRTKNSKKSKKSKSAKKKSKKKT